MAGGGTTAMRPGDDGATSIESPEVEATADRPNSEVADSTNVWPDAAAEEAFLTESRTQSGGVAPALATDAIEETDAQALPPLDDLVKRIPAEVREVLDDLFRVKYTSVRRVPKSALKG